MQERQETGDAVSIRVRKTPWRMSWQPGLAFLLGKSHEQGNLAGYSPKGHKEWDTTK